MHEPPPASPRPPPSTGTSECSPGSADSQVSQSCLAPRARMPASGIALYFRSGYPILASGSAIASSWVGSAACHSHSSMRAEGNADYCHRS
jgi:hypothetical protein